MTDIRFTVPGSPAGKARPVFYVTDSGKIQGSTRKKTSNYEKVIGYVARCTMKSKQPFTCPVAVTLNIDVAPPKSSSVKRQNEMIGTHCPKKPDIDNIAKLFLDAMNKIIYHDDNQVTELYVNKKYGHVAGVNVLVRACT